MLSVKLCNLSLDNLTLSILNPLPHETLLRGLLMYMQSDHKKYMDSNSAICKFCF